MASPQQSITTVNGRRCTRSRARTAATSTSTTEEPSIITPTEFTTSTAIAQAPQIQSSAVEQPSPPPSPSSTAPAEQPAIAPTTEAASSALGTISEIPISPVRITPLAILAPTAPVAAGPGQPANELSTPVAAALAEPSQVAVVTSAPPPSSPPPSSPPPSSPAIPTFPTSISSDTVAIAVPTLSPIASSIRPPSVTAPSVSTPQSTVDTVPEQPEQTDLQPVPSSTDTPAAEQPQQSQQPTSALASLPSGGSAGIIAPEQGSDGGGLTLPDTTDANIGSIVGGIIGGVACLALISGLLFYCLRRRKFRAPKWNEKRDAGSGLIEKLKTVPAGFGVFFAKMKGKKSGPMSNPYQRHTAQTSVSSVYSVQNGRVRSASEPQGMFAVQRAASIRSTSSKKSERNVLRKKPNSISSNYRFPDIREDSTVQSITVGMDPFIDSNPARNPPVGLKTPQPTASSARFSKDPFASLLDQIEDVPDWLRQSTSAGGHTRTQSSASALQSYVPLSANRNEGDPFADPSKTPSVPTQAVILNQRRRSSVAYPGFNALSTAASRDSQGTFFGEPGPSRPGTNLFTPGLATGRTVRQSDPFDLDRPEVLGFGSVVGRKEVRASVTRQATRSKRTSSVGNWASVVDGPYGPYEKDGEKTRQLWSAGGRR